MSKCGPTSMGGVTEQRWDTDRVFTVPNVLSFLRLAAIPVFVWLIIAGHYLAAVIVLAVSAVTDWFDGYLARSLRQRTKLGAQLDPITDRLYILSTIIAFMVRGIFPWWFVAILLARDLMLIMLVPSLRRSGQTYLPVNLVGKAGTFLLLLAFPVVLISAPEAFDFQAAYVLGWAIAVVGACLYWAAGVLYLRETVRLSRARRAEMSG